MSSSPSNNFTFTEEAFLLSSLHEVVKVWARGSGKANFIVNIDNGVAKLDISFTLGHPSDLHCVPREQEHPIPQHRADQDLSQDHVGVTGMKKIRKNRKTAARLARDRLRAEKFQTSKKEQEHEIIFPFTGKLLPVTTVTAQQEQASPDKTAAVPAAGGAGPPDPQREPFTPSPAAPPPCMADHVGRKAPAIGIDKADQNSVKKQLFQPGSWQPSGQLGDKNYKTKEAEKWSKLFK